MVVPVSELRLEPDNSYRNSLLSLVIKQEECVFSLLLWFAFLLHADLCIFI